MQHKFQPKYLLVLTFTLPTFTNNHFFYCRSLQTQGHRYIVGIKQRCTTDPNMKTIIKIVTKIGLTYECLGVSITITVET